MFRYIIAVAHNNVMGNGKFPTWIPRAHFDLLDKKTKGGIVVYGRKTWEANGKKLLAGRENIIVSSTIEQIPGAHVIPSIRDLPFGHNTYWILGGLRTFISYDRSINYSDGYITYVDVKAEGKIKFPENYDKYCEHQGIVQQGDNYITVRYKNLHPCI